MSISVVNRMLSITTTTTTTTTTAISAVTDSKDELSQEKEERKKIADYLNSPASPSPFRWELTNPISAFVPANDKLFLPIQIGYLRQAELDTTENVTQLVQQFRWHEDDGNPADLTWALQHMLESKLLNQENLDTLFSHIYPCQQTKIGHILDRLIYLGILTQENFDEVAEQIGSETENRSNSIYEQCMKIEKGPDPRATQEAFDKMMDEVYKLFVRVDVLPPKEVPDTTTAEDEFVLVDVEVDIEEEVSNTFGMRNR